MKLIVLNNARLERHRKAYLKTKTSIERIEKLEEWIEVLSISLRDMEKTLADQEKLFLKTLRLLHQYRKSLKS